MTAKPYVARVRPCHEAIARANLAALGFDAYVPTVREDVRTRFGRTTILAPMFPGYIFVTLDLSDRTWREAAHAKGIVELLPHSDSPTAIAARAMEWVRETEAAENAKKNAGPAPKIDVGDLVDVGGGSWDGYSGPIQGINSRRDRIRVLLTILGAAREVEVAAERVTRRIA